MRKSFFAVLLLVFCSAVLAQHAMNNNAVIKLAKAGLSDSVIVETINASQGSYDTTADGLIALKSAGVDDKVIAAIVLKSSGAANSDAASTPAASLPPGITDVGVYYKNKTGAWTQLMPEIVNFKTGGVLKTIATNGIVKGDVNGHINGKRAQVATTFPAELAVYVPEGTEITEYQLLRLRVQSKSREFRSVTGGVFHASGGASRDSLEFHAEKIAPRVYRITLDAGLGKGEYGLLPPGAIGSSNMASGGKIYTISIIE